VEPTQKTQKHVKPTFRFMPLRMSGGLFKLRKRYISKMYANMSGDAHLEITCTRKIQRLAIRTRGLWPRCRHCAMTNNTTFVTGMTTA